MSHCSNGIAHFGAALRIGIVFALFLAGCGPDPYSPSTTPTTLSTASALPESERPRAELVIGCWSIEASDCRFVADRIVAIAPAGRGAPFAVEVQLFPCEGGLPCPNTLAARQGKAIVEFLDGGEPIDYSLAGPPDAPLMAIQDTFYLGLTNPTSPRVGGTGPFPFAIGHCGISHVIDFDGSFWLPIGQVDGDDPTIINSESGAIRLLAPNHAEFRGESGFTVALARFPGPKHFWGCD